MVDMTPPGNGMPLLRHRSELWRLSLAFVLLTISLAGAASLLAPRLKHQPPINLAQHHQDIMAQSFMLRRLVPPLRSLNGGYAPDLSGLGLTLVHQSNLPHNSGLAHYSDLGLCRITLVFSPRKYAPERPANGLAIQWHHRDRTYSLISTSLSEQGFQTIARHLMTISADRFAREHPGHPASLPPSWQGCHNEGP